MYMGLTLILPLYCTCKQQIDDAFGLVQRNANQIITRKRDQQIQLARRPVMDTDTDTPLPLPSSVPVPWPPISDEPGLFYTMLQDMGVQGATIELIASTDKDHWEHLSSRMRGLIVAVNGNAAEYISYSNEASKKKGKYRTPDELIFLEEVVPNASATYSLLHVLLNLQEEPEPPIKIGEILSNFKNDQSRVSGSEVRTRI